MARWYSANVLETMPGGRRLWRFAAKGGHFLFDQEKTLTLSETAPSSLVGKDWQSLLRPKLNVAWLPADKVFFRAVQLPGADASEITAMVELQLEKLSPLPVTHILWSLYLMPRAATAKPDALQTVIVVIASRTYVEEFLGELQSQGFLPDRIETPGLDQLLAAKMAGDGVWLFPSAQGDSVLIAWQYGEAIQSLTLLPLPAGPDRGALLKAHIEQIAWAGEMEGWLTAPPRIHLVAGKAEAEAWEPLFKPWADGQVEIIPPAAPADLAAQSAQRTGSAGATTNLLPAEYSARYHQQLVDRLWMRGLLSVLAVYLTGVLAYFAFLYEYKRQYQATRTELAGISVAYTNAYNDEIQIQILKERQNLKYAALDCWKAVALSLPESVTLEYMFFNRTKLDLRGVSSSDQPDDIYSFNDALRHAQDPGKSGLLFSEVGPPRTTSKPGKTEWNFSCTLPSTETQ
jgi:hypothetical protein